MSHHWIHRLVLVSAFTYTGCGVHPLQSVLHPAGLDAAEVAVLWWVMFAISMAVFVVVVGAALVAYRKRASGAEPPLGATGFVLAGGVVMPLIILVVLLFFSLRSTAQLGAGESELTIKVVGYQWWWEVSYPARGITTANEIYLPAGKRVRVEVTSADVIHSLWIPNLQGKIDAIPNQVNSLLFTAEKPGTYRGQCAEFCGLQHARMGLTVVVQESAIFEEWLKAKAQFLVPDHKADVGTVLTRGQRVFFDASCHACHTIRGTRATGKAGPDLTHIGSRQTLGAATLINSHGALAGWVANPQAIKPGIFMPPSYLAPDDLHALIAYLMSLQ